MKSRQTTPIHPQTVIGLMSGTSLDGLDIAISQFQRLDSGKVLGELLQFDSVPFPNDLKRRLESLYAADAREWVECSTAFSTWCGLALQSFSGGELIGFHGQTVFHNPKSGYTGQLASGAHLHAATGLPVVCDFRSLDVALGGQGAPLVPVADAMLFPEAEVAVNLGGIANMSASDFSGSRWACDITPCNLLLNALAQRVGQPCDWNGELAAKGQVIPALAQHLQSHPFHQLNAPKSLGREAIDAHWWPLIRAFDSHPLPDLLATITADIAAHVAAAIGPRKALITGGGAWNVELMRQIQEFPGLVLLPASKEVIDGKEAHAFGLLAWMRVHGMVNTWSKVTGARRDSVGGCIYGDVRHLYA